MRTSPITRAVLSAWRPSASHPTSRQHSSFCSCPRSKDDYEMDTLPLRPRRCVSIPGELEVRGGEPRMTKRYHSMLRLNKLHVENLCILFTFHPTRALSSRISIGIHAYLRARKYLYTESAPDLSSSRSSRSLSDTSPGHASVHRRRCRGLCRTGGLSSVQIPVDCGERSSQVPVTGSSN